MTDEQVHEFHLDGKQMVFLFMASTVVAVVIFLCGVMVGRGVRASKTAETVVTAAADLADPTASAQTTDANDTAVPTTPTATATPPAVVPEDPTEPAPSSKNPESAKTRAQKSGSSTSAVSEQPSDRPREAVAAKSNVETPSAERDTRSRAPDEPKAPPSAGGKDARSSVTSSFREPAGSGYAVQVMTTSRLADAQAEARKLQAKGYSPFLLPMGNGKSGFRVRVGKYKTLKEAESAKAGLEKVEKYKKAWVPPR